MVTCEGLFGYESVRLYIPWGSPACGCMLVLNLRISNSAKKHIANTIFGMLAMET